MLKTRYTIKETKLEKMIIICFRQTDVRIRTRIKGRQQFVCYKMGFNGPLSRH